MLSEPGFAAFYIAIASIQLVGLALIVLSITSLCSNSDILRPLAVFLVNQLAACIIFIIHTSCIFLTSFVLALSGDLPSPPLSFCQLVTFIITLYVALPYPVYAAQYVDNVACFPHNEIIPRASRYPTLAIWVVAGGIIPLAISITIPIITLYYIKRNIVTEGADYNKRISKFALFLVTGNIVNLFGQLIPGLIALNAEVPGVVLACLLVTLSPLPTPIIIVVFLKPVRERICNILCFLCVSREHVYIIEESLPTASTSAT